jgi:hypothetical protein
MTHRQTTQGKREQQERIARTDCNTRTCFKMLCGLHTRLNQPHMTLLQTL